MTYSALNTAYARPVRVTLAVPAISIPMLSRYILLGVLFCLLLLIYLVQATAMNANGYKLNDYQTQAAELQKEHDSLVLASAQMQGMDRQAAYASETGMVAVTPN